MIGFILYITQLIGSSVFAIRLPAVIFSSLIGVGIYYFLKRIDSRRGALAAIFYLLSPINILNAIVTTDTPLMLFSFLSAIALYAAIQNNLYRYYLLSGVLLGMAFFSKYFAALLGFSYLLYYLCSSKNRFNTIGFAIVFVSVVPFAALNIYWNYTHCWANIMFNIFNRNAIAGFNLTNIAAYALCVAYLLTPPVIYYIFKERSAFKNILFKNDSLKLFVFIFIAPLTIFAAVSLGRIVGLHWLLSFFPFMYILLAKALSEIQLIKSVKFTAYFSLAHVALVAVLLLTWEPLLQNSKKYSSIVISANAPDIIKYFPDRDDKFNIASTSYADAALIEFYYRKPVAVFGGGSYHARQDDIKTDYKTLDGGNILILLKSKPKLEQYALFFQNTEIEEIVVNKAAFYLLKGYVFNYAAYRDKVLSSVRDRYYDIPSYLPTPKCGCYFFDKYFAEETS